MKIIQQEWKLPFNVPSLKNSKVKTSRGIFHSKTVKSYLNKIGIQSYSPSKKIVKGYKTKPNLFEQCLITDTHNIDVYQVQQDGLHFDDNWGYMSFKDCVERMTDNFSVPLELGFHQVRDSKRKFDLNNSFELILDLLTAHNIIPDDNCDCLIPIPYKIEDRWHTVDKENAGVFLKILNRL